MLTWCQAVVLAVVEGLTEFLPVSSTGHMILVGRLLGITSTDFVKTFEIFIQLGAVLAVACLYANTLWRHKQWWWRIVVAFLPTGLVGLLLYPVVKQYLLGSDVLVAVTLMLGGVFILWFESNGRSRGPGVSDIDKLDKKKLVSIGLFQSLSVIPGVSRAAATIIGGMVVGLTRKQAVEFSFLLSLPTMFSATGLDLVRSAGSFGSKQVQILILGFVVAFVCALVVVKAFLSYVSRGDLKRFGYYRILVGLLYLAVFILG